jgi:hypothetical protein
LNSVIVSRSWFVVDNKKQEINAWSTLVPGGEMNKVLRKRISNVALIIVTVATGLVIAGAIALSRPLPEYLVAKTPLIPGEEIGVESFELQRLDLGPAGRHYLTLQNAPEVFYLNEFVSEGELVPIRNVLDFAPDGLTTIVLSPSLEVSQKVSAGSWVQIWRTIPTENNFLGELLVPRSQVVAVTEGSSLMSDRGTLVEVMVSQEQAGLLLQTVSSDLDIFLLVAP